MVSNRNSADIGKAILSELFKEVEILPSFHRVNTMAYHLQTDGLIKRCNRTLIAMLVKTTKKGLLDWDRCLPHVLYLHTGLLSSLPWSHHFFCYMDVT